MTEPRPERRAYFASLATPDLIVCATIERGSFTPDDLRLIQEELLRRGLDPARLAQPGTTSEPVIGARPQYYTGPLPTAGRWWNEGWSLFKEHFQFLGVLTLVLFAVDFVLWHSVGASDSWVLTFGLLARLFLFLAFDALYAGAVMRGLCRRMTRGHCSVGRAISLGLEKWGWVFVNSLKAAALSVGPFFLFLILAYSTDEHGLVALGIILLLYPGIWLFLRYIWVQPLAALDPARENPLVASARLTGGRYGRVFMFVLVGLVLLWLVVLGALIAKAILPGWFLEVFASGYLFVLFRVCTKVAILVGYLYLVSGPAKADIGAEAANGAMPPPPGL